MAGGRFNPCQSAQFRPQLRRLEREDAFATDRLQTPFRVRTIQRVCRQPAQRGYITDGECFGVVEITGASQNSSQALEQERRRKTRRFSASAGQYQPIRLGRLGVLEQRLAPRLELGIVARKQLRLRNLCDLEDALRSELAWRRNDRFELFQIAAFQLNGWLSARDEKILHRPAEQAEDIV